ncbi:SAM-dependent methyltransferase, partial [Streptomyces umbrinus]
MADAPTGKVTFVGAGPGAADLLTFRAARAIAEADVVIWAASLVLPACTTRSSWNRSTPATEPSPLLSPYGPGP